MHCNVQLREAVAIIPSIICSSPVGIIGKTVDLSAWDPSDDCLAALCAQRLTVGALTLRSCIHLTSRGLQLLSVYGPSMRQLSLEGCVQLQAGALCVALSAFPSLTRLVAELTHTNSPPKHTTGVHCCIHCLHEFCYGIVYGCRLKRTFEKHAATHICTHTYTNSDVLAF
jgi:hypothetical protein